MKKFITFETKTDLKLWVADRVGDGVSESEILDIVQVIHGMGPNYGEDYSETIESLPEHLIELI